MSIVRHQCAHCHAQWKSSDEDTKLYCKNCSTKEQREKMDKENIENFKNQGLVYNQPVIKK